MTDYIEILDDGSHGIAATDHYRSIAAMVDDVMDGHRYIRIDAPELLAVVDALRHVTVAGALDEELRSNVLKAWDEVVG